MSRFTLQEYLNERINDVNTYIEFNERKDDKDFFAHKELELYQMAQKYMLLTDELGCPLDVVFKALKDSEIVVKHTYGYDEPIEKLKTHKISELQFYKTDFVFWLYEDIVTDFEFDVNVKDYKKTWWLKEDLSE